MRVLKANLILLSVIGVVLVYLLTPPTPFDDRLVIIDSHTVDNGYYDDSEAMPWWDVSSRAAGGLHALNDARVPYFLSQLPRKGRILDIGCGGGILTEPLARKSEELRMTGLDLSPHSIATARMHAAESGLNISYIEGSAYQLPFPDASFDGIVCSDVVEHLDDLGKWADEVVRVLKPSGIIVFDTINRSWLSWALAIQLLQELLGTPPRGTHDHRMFITPAEFRKLLELRGMSLGPFVGMGPVGLRPWREVLSALKHLNVIGAFKFGQVSDLSLSYFGYAVKN